MDKINITLRKDQNLYFTSDLHFGHRNVIRFCGRPFQNEKEMGEAMIRNWNSVVQEDDIIINLGDTFWFNDRHGVKKVMSKLQGIKYFILGNHCEKKQYELCDDPNLTICSDITVFYIRGEQSDPRFQYLAQDGTIKTRTYELVCCHYPCTCYSHSGNPNTYMFFGHIHSQRDQPMTEFGEAIRLPHNHYMDVGADRHNYTPVEFFDLLVEVDSYPWWDMHK